MANEFTTRVNPKKPIVSFVVSPRLGEGANYATIRFQIGEAIEVKTIATTMELVAMRNELSLAIDWIRRKG